MKLTRVGLALCILCCSLLTAAARSVDLKWDPLFDTQVNAQFESIRAKLDESSGHDWAGVYAMGDGLGFNLSLAISPDEGIAARLHGCVWHSSNRGTIASGSDGGLHFNFDRPNRDAFGGFPEDVLPVRWGERRYLIAESRLMEFVSAINHGHEPRGGPYGSFLLAQGDEQKPAVGSPTLPPQYLQLIRAQALTPRVTQVWALADLKEKYFCQKRYRLELDHGSGDGLTPGMELILSVPADYAGEDCHSFEVPTPEIGWQLTTGALDLADANRKILAAAEDRAARVREDDAIPEVLLPTP